MSHSTNQHWDLDELRAFEERLGVKFHDYSLLDRALTHRSYLNENPESALADNERLEFLGDAIIDFQVAALLYHRFPEIDEGELTTLRASLVRAETLSEFARELDIGVACGWGMARTRAAAVTGQPSSAPALKPSSARFTWFRDWMRRRPLLTGWCRPPSSASGGSLHKDARAGSDLGPGPVQHHAALRDDRQRGAGSCQRSLRFRCLWTMKCGAKGAV
ncbi:MAG: ribonuclease III domain-containing protein [Chloroflexota bacterium]